MAKKATNPYDDPAIKLLRALHRDSAGQGLIEMRAIPHDKTLDATRIWTASSSEVIEFARQYGDRKSGHSVYFGVCKRSHRGGKKPDVMAATALWADVDTQNAGLDTDATLVALYELRGALQPSAIIKSGGGLHLYWFLKEPVELNGDREAITAVENANRKLAYLVGGDNVHDVTRVMRLPGTMNSKRGVHFAKPCSIVYCYPDTRRDFTELVKAVDAQDRVLLGGRWVTPAEAERSLATPLAGSMDADATVGRALEFARVQGGARLEQRLAEMWHDRVRYKPGRGYMGIDEAVMITAARLWCKYGKVKGSDKSVAIERVVAKTLVYLRGFGVRWEAGEWPVEHQKAAVRAKLLRWVPKWESVQKEATGKQRHEQSRQIP